MKRNAWMICIAAILVISVAFGSASAAIRRTRLFAWEEWFQFAAENTDVWLADDEGVWLSRKRTAPQLVLELPDVSALDAYDGGVYALHKDGAYDIISFIDYEYGLSRKWVLPDMGGYCGIVALQEKIALLVGEPDDCTLAFLDKTNGSVQEIEGVEGLSYISRRSETSVFASSLIYGKIVRADTDGRVEEIYRGGFYAQSILEEEDGSILLFGQSAGLYMLSRLLPGEELQELGVIDIPGLINGGKITGDKLYVDANSTLYQMEIAGFEAAAGSTPTQVLTVAMHDSHVWPFPTAAVRAFKAQNPGVDVKLVRVSEEDLALMLMADASKYDLLYLDWSDSDSILRADIVEDLSAYPALMEQRQNWIDIGAMYDSQGRWIRVPVDLRSPYVLLPVSKDRGIYEDIGIEWKNGLSYERFIELCKDARAKDMYLMGTLIDLNNQFYQYSIMHGNSMDEGVMHFDTPEFRQMLEFWKYLYAEGLVPMSDGAELADADMFYLDIDEFNFTDVRPSQFSAILNGTYLYPPTPDGEKIAPIEVGAALYLNRYGVQKDLAVDFIATYMSPEVQSELLVDDPEKSTMFLNDFSLYDSLEDNVYYYMYNFEPETYANWIEVLENTRYYGYLYDELRRPFHSMLREHFAGELELEDFVAGMEKQADIWMNE